MVAGLTKIMSYWFFFIAGMNLLVALHCLQVQGSPGVYLLAGSAITCAVASVWLGFRFLRRHRTLLQDQDALGDHDFPQDAEELGYEL